MVHFACYGTPCAQNQNGACYLQLMALLTALTVKYINRYAHQMGQSLSRGREIAAESYALLPNLKKGLLFAIGRGSIILASIFYTPAVKYFGIKRVVNSVTKGCVAASNELAPFRFHDVVVGCRSMSRTPKLAGSN